MLVVSVLSRPRLSNLTYNSWRFSRKVASKKKNFYAEVNYNVKRLFNSSTSEKINKNSLYNQTAFFQRYLCPAEEQNLFKKLYFARGFKVTCRRDVHPFVWIVLRPMFKIAAILTGRGFRKWWKDLPKEKRKYFIEQMKKNKTKILSFIFVIGCLFVIYYQSHIEETPITKRKRFIAFNKIQSKQIADYEFQKVFNDNRQEMLPAYHPACKRVEHVVKRLLYANTDISETLDKEWTIAVIGSPEENAFVLPNGQIFVFSGMLNLCSNDDQLAAVLAHEMSHCILGHGIENFSFVHLLDFIMIVFIAAIWAVLPSDLIAMFTHWLFKESIEILLHFPYNRKIETEADEVGLNLAAKACFDVRESSAFWTKMAAIHSSGDIPTIEFLSTHPSHETRSTHLDSIMDKALELRKLRGCPSLRSPDPRLAAAQLGKILEERKKVLEQKTQKVIVIPPSY